MNVKTVAIPIFAVCACLFLRASAETTDLAATVKRFEALGMPNVAGAEYVRLTNPADGFTRTTLPWREGEMSGNAWLVCESRDAAGRRVGRFVMNGGESREITFMDAGTSGEEREAAFPYARWEKARLARDVNSIRKQFAQNPSGWLAGKNRNVDIFMFALQLFQRGDDETAAELVGQMMEVEVRGELEKQAAHRLADGLYASVIWEFMRSGDWKGYRDGINGLLARFPVDWPTARRLRELRPLVERRMAGRQPVTAPLLSEADRELATGLDGLRERFVPNWTPNGLGILWALPEAWPEDAAERAFGREDLAVRARGIEAFWILLALKDDTALTGCLMPGRYEDGEMEGFGHVPQVMSRGDVAVRILADMLPRRTAQFSWSPEKGNAERIIRAAREMHAAHKGGSPDELAVRYLPLEHGGFGGLDDSARAYLQGLARKRAVPAYAGFLANEATLADTYGFDTCADEAVDALVRYAAVRGAEARPYLDALGARLEADAAKLVPERGASEWSGKNEARVRQTQEKRRGTARLLRTLPLDVSDEELAKAGETEEELTLRRAMLDARNGGFSPRRQRERETRLGGRPDEAAAPVPAPVADGAEMRRRLAAPSSRAEAAVALGGLSAPERAALPELLRQDAALAERLAGFAGIVEEVSVTGDDAFGARLNEWKGRRMAAELADAVEAYCMERTRAGGNVVGVLARGENLGGWSVTVRPHSEGETKGWVDGLCGIACERGVYADARLHTGGMESLRQMGWDAQSYADPEQMGMFRRTVADVCAGTNGVPEQGLIIFNTERKKR